MKSTAKVCFKLRPSQGNVLEFAEIKRETSSPFTEVNRNRRTLKSWKGKLMRKLKNKEENGEEEVEDDLELYKELKLKTSTFRSYPFISLYILTLIRFLIFFYSGYLLKNLWNNFYATIGEFCGEKVNEKLKKHELFIKLFANLLVASKDSDRCLILIGLGIFLPIISIFYGYLVGFLITFYTATFDLGTDDLEKSIWIDYCEKKERGSKSKSFFMNRLESCSARLDCVLGYSFTLPLMNFLSYFNFKIVPKISISSGLLLIFLILTDEFLIMKRKFEIDAMLKFLKMYTVIVIIGLCWIFFIR